MLMSASTDAIPGSQPSPLFRWAWPAVLGGLLLLLFAPTLLQLVEVWNRDPNYSHGFLVLPVSLWLAWRYASQTPVPAEGEAGLGAIPLLLGCILHIPAVFIAWPPLDFVALGLVLRGLAVTAGGRRWAAGFTFPILFLFFMFPLPLTWTNFAALQLQDLVTAVSAAILDLFVVCYRRGHALYVAGIPDNLLVAPECSGLRQIVAFVALGALGGHLFRKPILFRLLLILAAVPIAILANAFRVVLMALGVRWFGSGWVASWLHDVPALLTLPLGLALFGLAGLWLGRLWPARNKEPLPCA
ncbi:MAG: exosortase/archaeosortase family protein [Gemmataceae bacterium]|nr:exosortase/archaeosortase family protein [Gemmataceae bacterium]